MILKMPFWWGKAANTSIIVKLCNTTVKKKILEKRADLKGSQPPYKYK